MQITQDEISDDAPFPVVQTQEMYGSRQLLQISFWA